MSPEQIGIVGIVALTVLTLVRVPLGAAMGLVGFAGYAAIAGLDRAAYLIGITPENLVSHSFSVLPLFILMGVVATESGMSKEILAAANALFAGRRGALAMATIGGCAGFSAVSGSSIATAGTFAKICIPEMRLYGYDVRVATGAVAAGGTLGILIPPSGMMVIYALAAQESVPKLFAAGLIPGLILTLLFLVVIFVIGRVRPDWTPEGAPLPRRERLTRLLGSWKFLLLFLIAVGGIYSGWFSPTEAAAVAAFVAVVIALATRTITVRGLWKSLIETLLTTSMLMFVVIGAWYFSYFIALTRIPSTLVELIGEAGLSPQLVMVLALIFFIFLGCFMDSISIILITLPVFLPLMTSLGYDPIWYGIFMVVVVEIGLITPPVGMNVFVIKGQMPDISMSAIFAGVLPFLGAHAVLVGLLIAFPQIALWLPQVLYGTP